MKSLSFIGFILLGLAAILFYFIPNFSVIRLFEPTTLMGILAGVGIGLILGGMVGYVSKGSAIREEQKRKEIEQLRKEKAALEKQAATLANQQAANAQQSVQNQNPQNL